MCASHPSRRPYRTSTAAPRGSVDRRASRARVGRHGFSGANRPYGSRQLTTVPLRLVGRDPGSGLLLHGELVVGHRGSFGVGIVVRRAADRSRSQGSRATPPPAPPPGGRAAGARPAVHPAHAADARPTANLMTQIGSPPATRLPSLRRSSTAASWTRACRP
jgi:hypothetical protein